MQINNVGRNNMYLNNNECSLKKYAKNGRVCISSYRKAVRLGARIRIDHVQFFSHQTRRISQKRPSVRLRNYRLRVIFQRLNCHLLIPKCTHTHILPTLPFAELAKKKSVCCSHRPSMTLQSKYLLVQFVHVQHRLR